MAATRGRKQVQKAREEHQQEVFDALKALLTSLGAGVTVSKSLEGRGGECLLRGQRRVIVSRRLPLSERIEVLVDVVGQHDLSGVEIPEVLGEVLAPLLGAPSARTSAR